jgi:hypothetical protein
MSGKEDKVRDFVTQSSVLSPRYSEDNSALSRSHSLFLSIAGITIDLFTDEPGMKLQVDGATQNFLMDEAQPDMTVRAAWEDLSKRTLGRKLFDAGPVWQLYHQDGSYVFSFTSSVHGPIPYKIACFDREFTSGEVQLHAPCFNTAQSVYPLEYPLDELLFSNLLTRGRGVEIHACGVIIPSGEGYLFAGQSEAGKSTIARLWQKHDGIRILSDDRIILRKLNGKIWMYGTPWHGDAKLALPDRAPLRGIYFLQKGSNNELVSVKATDATARLFACSFPPFYSREGLDFTLGFLGEVTKEIPCYELRFVPDQHVVDFIQTT